MLNNPLIKNILLITAFVAAVTALLLNVFRPSAKMGWIDLPAVYKDFDYKKEMEAKLIKTQEARKGILDSMEMELRLLSEEINAEGQKDKAKIRLYQFKGEQYVNKKKIFEDDNYENKARYEEQILNQLNQYVKDFGVEKGYAFIYGADGSGTIMHGDKVLDITDQVKVYVNGKYKGIK